jgi:hypothetical protein
MPKPHWLLIPVRWLAHLGTWLLAVLVAFEEWGWEPLQHVLARIGRWPGFRWIEGFVRTLPPWAALALFVLPSLLLLPIKLLALWAMGHGHVGLGMLIILAAKVVGTAVLARLFTLTRPALMQLHWFAWLYTRWVGFKDPLLARARASWPWRAARAIKRRLSTRLRVLGRLWWRDHTPPGPGA